MKIQDLNKGKFYFMRAFWNRFLNEVRKAAAQLLTGTDNREDSTAIFSIMSFAGATQAKMQYLRGCIFSLIQHGAADV